MMEKTLDPIIVKIWKAPPTAGTGAKYVTVTRQGELLGAYAKLSDIRKYYKTAIQLDVIKLERELDKVYQQKS